MAQFRTLVFEGGGVKGIAYAGALKQLENEGILPEVTRVAGTSAGAIVAALIALGASSDQVAKAVGDTSFASFMDDSFGLIRDTDRLVRDYGWYKGDEFVHWMRDRVGELTGNPNYTFGNLWTDVQNGTKPRFRKLYVNGSNLNRQETITYSGMTPTVSIADGVRVSMSIPLFFVAQRDKDHNVLVDGGVTWNYPIDMFDYSRFVSDPAHSSPSPIVVSVPDYVYNKEVLGLRVDTNREIQAAKYTFQLPPVNITNFIDYAKCLVGYMGALANRMHLHDNDWHRTIFIDASGVGTTEFKLTNAKRDMLIRNGQQGVIDYFKWFRDPTAVPAPLNRV